jgi:serine protease inhibitor
LLVVLPKTKDGLAVLENRWATQKKFRQVTDGLDPETVIVSLPRFKIEAEFKLKPA